MEVLEMELSTTVDPSYVIRLIRQILPVSGEEHENRTDFSAEEAGCVLWDLAANESTAELMVDNLIIDVLFSSLQVPLPNRMREICIGILGNLACFVRPSRVIADKQELLSIIVEQLCLTDTQTLVETCRLLNSGLHTEEADKWSEAMKSDQVLERLLWIANNTLNDQLLEKVMELLRTMVDSSKTTTAVHLPRLIPLGIVSLLKTLITSQLNGSTDARDAVLDLSFQVALEISLSDEFAAHLDKELIALVYQVIRVSWMDDVSVSAVTAMVLLANLISERSELVKEICEDGVLVERLLALLPATCDDQNARHALWSIVRTLCLTKDSPNIISIARQITGLITDLEEDEIVEEKQSLAAKLETMNEFLNTFNDWLVSHANDDDAVVVNDASELLTRVLRRWR